MAVKRTNLSIPAGLYDRAQKAMADQHYESFSEYIAALIRADALGSRETDASRLKEDSGDYNAARKAKNAAAPMRTDFFAVTRKG